MFNPRLEDFFDDFLAYADNIGRSEITIKEYRRMLYGPISTIAHMRINKITSIDITRAINSAKQHGIYGPSKTVVTMRALLKFIKKQNRYKIFIDWRDIEMVKTPDYDVQYLTPGDIDCVRNSIDIDTQIGLRTRVLCEVLLHTGLRIGEALSLDINDINFEELKLTVKNNKNYRIQVVMMTPTCAQWILRYLRERTDSLPYLFVSSKNSRLLSVTARASLAKIQKKCNINKRIHWHILRKTFVTNLLHSGVDVKTTQHLARHRSVVTTLKHYAAINNEASQKIINIIDKF